MNKCVERLQNGIIKENPTFVLMLGMCPTLAVTSSAINGLGMGLTTAVVLIMSNVLISLLRKVIPDKVRIPAFIVIVASLVTIVQLLLQAYIPFLYDALGIYIPLIVVNCIILGRAESYASQNDVLSSAFDGLGMGLGFTVGLTAIGIVREIVGGGAIFGFGFAEKVHYEPMSIFVMAPGAFFVLAMLTALQNKFKAPSATNVPDAALSCGGNCASCSGSACAANHGILEAEKAAAQAEKLAQAKKAAEAKKAAAAKASATKEAGKAGAKKAEKAGTDAKTAKKESAAGAEKASGPKKKED